MKIKILCLAIFAAIGSSAFAYDDVGTIKSVEPQYSSVNEPREVCHESIVREIVKPQVQQHEKNYGGTILGGLAGGILGNQVGGGNGKTVATAVGAVAGALIGDNMVNSNNQNNDNTRYEPQETSRKVRTCAYEDNFVQVLSGYKINYVYNGNNLSYLANERPRGQRIKVNVEVKPILF
ncbi:glycine zipper 2TM domain-containing protein [archaeon]|nr:glycine zipper 2TM domain-containing protein [archaeon]